MGATISIVAAPRAVGADEKLSVEIGLASAYEACARIGVDNDPVTHVGGVIGLDNGPLAKPDFSELDFPDQRDAGEDGGANEWNRLGEDASSAVAENLLITKAKRVLVKSIYVSETSIKTRIEQ